MFLRHFAGKSAYHIEDKVEQIQTELMTNGPVEGAFSVYSDFPSYKSGNYSNTLLSGNDNS